MKLSVRIFIFSIVMAIVTFAMYKIVTCIALPWLMTLDGTMFSFSLIIGTMFGMAVWCWIAEVICKMLKCDRLVEKLIEEK